MVCNATAEKYDARNSGQAAGFDYTTKGIFSGITSSLIGLVGGLLAAMTAASLPRYGDTDMPLVFVKFKDEKPVDINAGPNDTIVGVVAIAYARLYPSSIPPTDKELEVVLDGKPINNLSVTVGDLNLQTGKMLVAEILSARTPDIDDGSLDAFKKFLRISAGELGNGEVVFISVACFDNNHGKESIERQQCPPRLLSYCLENKIDLNIVLVDPAFADPSLKYSQIYDYPGWRLLSNEDHGKIRQYTYTPAVSARACDVWLTVFSAPIPEFRMDLGGGGKILGGIMIPSVFASLENSTTARSCLICGCFAFEPLDASQYFTMGSREVIEGAGFRFNS